MKILFNIFILCILLNTNFYAQDSILQKPKKNIWGVQSGFNYTIEDPLYYNNGGKYYSGSNLFPTFQVFWAKKKIYNMIGIKCMKFSNSMEELPGYSYPYSLINAIKKRIEIDYIIYYTLPSIFKVIPYAGFREVGHYFKYTDTHQSVIKEVVQEGKGISSNFLLGAKKILSSKMTFNLDFSFEITDWGYFKYKDSQSNFYAWKGYYTYWKNFRLQYIQATIGYKFIKPSSSSTPLPN